MNKEDLIVLIEKTRSNVKKKVGVDFEDEFDVREVTNGWKALLHYRSSITRNIRINVKLDITKSHLENIFLPVEKIPMFHDYSDSCETKLLTYSLNEIMAEKMRALFDRGWPRDFYDVYQLWEIIDLKKTIPLFAKKCKFKGITPDINSIIMDKMQIAESWKRSLGHQMKEIPDFEDVFSTVLTRFEALDIK